MSNAARARTGHGATVLRLVLLAAGGAGLGLLAARYLLVGSWLSLIPWAAAALAVGRAAHTTRRAVGDGVVFGFALAAGFMIFGYDGTAPLLTRLPAFALLGLVGAGCAATLAVLALRLARWTNAPWRRSVPGR